MTDVQDPKSPAEFAPATEQAWRGLVDKVLKGAPFAKLESRTHDGFTIEPLYPRDVAAAAVPGRAAGAPWTIMQRVDHPDPAAANAQALDDLENGATGLVLVFAGSVSANGYGLDPSPTTLARVLDGVYLDAGVVIDLNVSPATRHVVHDLAALVKSRGLAPAAVDIRWSINPLGGFAAAGASAKS
jgi:methylmalonyl-CoA mutase